MRLVVMGTGPFAVPMFRQLVGCGRYAVQSLVTRPPVANPRQRGSPPANPMRQAAEDLGIEVLLPADVNSPDSRAALAARQPDLLVVCDYGQLLAPETLAIAPLGGINLHGSLLPKYRGAAPVQWAVWNGDATTGVTVIHMTPKLDAGPCLVQASVAIGPAETAQELEQRLAELGVDAVARAIGVLANWDRVAPLGQPQDIALASRAPRLRREHGLVDWRRSASDIHNQVRALQPWPGTFTNVAAAAGRTALRLILDQVRVVPSGDRLTTAVPPGTILRAEGSELLVQTGAGQIAIDRLQPSGKKAMSTADFLRGHRDLQGVVLG